MGGNFNPPGDDSCESIATVRAELRAMRECVFLLTHSKSSRDRSPQPGLYSLASDASRSAAPSTLPEPMPSDAELAKIARTPRDRTTRNHSLLLYRDCSEGEPSEVNGPVHSQYHIEKCLTYS